jgi:hypothetical protein
VDEAIKLIPSCDDLARSVSDGSYDEGPAWDRLRLRLHMIACYVCRRYAAQIRWIDRAARTCWSPSGSADDEIFKRRLIGRLKS